jgi:hypothetical protein
VLEATPLLKIIGHAMLPISICRILSASLTLHGQVKIKH